MRINTVKLKNIGPHKDLSVDFGRGLIGLIGSNGAGKSTLVNSIYAALTNDFSRFGNAKAEIITNGSTEESYIHLAGEHRGQLFELTRWLKPNKSEFIFGSKSYSKASDINEAVVEQLNIPKLVIDKYVFVNQWEMFSFLDQSASERAKTFQYLCGTEAATLAHKVCSDYVLKQKNLQVVDNSLELQSALTCAKESMAEHRKKVKSYARFILDEEQLNRCNDILDRETTAIECKEELESEEEEKHRLQRSIQVQGLVLQDLQQKIDKRLAWQEKNKAGIAAAYDLLEAYAEYESAVSVVAKANKNIEQLKQKLVGLNCPDKNDELYADKAEQKALTATQARLELLISQTEGASLEDAVCSSCLQKIKPEHREKLLQAEKKNRTELELVSSKLSYSEQYDLDIAAFETKRAEINNAIKRFEAVVAENQKTIDSYGGGDKEEAETLTEKEKEVQAQLLSLQKKAKTATGLKDSDEGNLKSVLARIAKLQRKIDNRPDGKELANAQMDVSRHNKVTLLHQTALGAYREAKKSRDRAQTTLDSLQEQLAKQAKIRNLLDTIEEAGEVFHWNNLPKVVSQANLELLVSDINSNLSLFNSPFTVEADQDLTFKVFFPGQLPVKAKQLSGGQKVMLAIAFRAALDRVFGHDTGMMYLDEPTAGLDADNVKYFHDALQRLAEKLGTDRQLVVITHVHELSGAFDQLVQL